MRVDDIHKDYHMIALEGIDGCGKGAIIEELKKQLPGWINLVVLGIDKGFDENSQSVRESVLNPKTPRSVCQYGFAYLAMLVQRHLEEILIDAPKNTVIIMDRHLLSSILYSEYVGTPAWQFGYYHNITPCDDYVIINSDYFLCKERLLKTLQEHPREIDLYDFNEGLQVEMAHQYKHFNRSKYPLLAHSRFIHLDGISFDFKNLATQIIEHCVPDSYKFPPDHVPFHSVPWFPKKEEEN